MAHLKVDIYGLIKMLWDSRSWISRPEFKKIALEKLAAALNEDIRLHHEGSEIDVAKLTQSLTTIDISVVGLKGIKEAIGNAYHLKWGDVWDTQEELVRLIREYAIEITRAYDFLIDKEVEKISAKMVLYMKLLKVIAITVLAMTVTFLILMTLSSMIFGLGLMPALMSGPILLLYTPNTLISSPSGLFIVLASLVSGAMNGMGALKSYLKYVWTKQKGLSASDIDEMKSKAAEKVSEILELIDHVIAKHRKIKQERSA